MPSQTKQVHPLPLPRLASVSRRGSLITGDGDFRGREQPIIYLLAVAQCERTARSTDHFPLPPYRMRPPRKGRVCRVVETRRHGKERDWTCQRIITRIQRETLCIAVYNTYCYAQNHMALAKPLVPPCTRRGDGRASCTSDVKPERGHPLAIIAHDNCLQNRALVQSALRRRNYHNVYLECWSDSIDMATLTDAPAPWTRLTTPTRGLPASVSSRICLQVLGNVTALCIR